MANRQFRSQFQYGMEGMVVELFLHATFAGSGAVTLDATNSKGIASITKEATAGQYTIVLQDSYNKLLGLSHIQLLASGDPAAPTMFIKSQTVSATTKAITVQYEAPDGVTETNPSTGEEVFMCITLGNSSV